MSGRNIFARPARLAAIAPYLWMALFFLVPFIFVVKISLSQTAIAQPPYTPVFDLTAGVGAIKAAFAALSTDNFRLLVSDDLYVLSYLRSLVVAVVSTSILLLIGYPVAYGMARLPARWQSASCAPSPVARACVRRSSYIARELRQVCAMPIASPGGWALTAGSA